MKILRVVRVIEFEGPEEWIERVLEQSWLEEYPARKELVGGRVARELARVVTELEVHKEPI